MNTESDLDFLVGPFGKFIQNNTIITNQWNLLFLHFAIAPVLGHPLFEYTDGRILFTNMEFIRNLFENGDTFLDAIAHRFFDLE